MYARTTLELNSLDLLNLITLTKRRIKDCRDAKDKENPNSLTNVLADEVIDIYKGTLKRLEAALKVIDDEVEADRNNAKKKRTSGKRVVV